MGNLACVLSLQNGFMKSATVVLEFQKELSVCKKAQLIAKI